MTYLTYKKLSDDHEKKLREQIARETCSNCGENMLTGTPCQSHTISITP